MALISLAAAALLHMVQTNPAWDALAQRLPVRGEPLFGQGMGQLEVTGPPDLVRHERRSDPQAPFSDVLRVELLRAGQNGYEAQVQTRPTVIPVRQGDTLLFSYQVRCLQGGRETGEGAFAAYVQRPAPPWDGTGSSSVTVGRAWKPVYFAVKAEKDFPAGQLQIAFHVSGQPQTLEFAAFVALNLGQGIAMDRLPVTPISYAGREANAPWRKRAEQMIEKNRKANLSITVVDARGRPRPGIPVTVRLVQHEYVFGSFTDYEAGKPGPEGERYRAAMKRLFNRVTVPIYWADWGWESAETRANYFRIMDWCVADRIRMKAHCLLWPSLRFSPSRLQPLMKDPPALRQAIFETMDARIAALRKYPFENMDVLNELKSEREFAQVLGPSLYGETFRRARAGWPKATLVYNDYAVFEGGGEDLSSQRVWEGEVQGLLQQKAPVGMLGWQAHFGESLTSPERVWQLLDRYNQRFGLPFEITEFDVETRDERAQADYTRDLLTAWFAHPATRGFTMWGFWEGPHWKPLGAMLRRDYSEKPMAKEWVRLTQQVWTTRATVWTDTRGVAEVRGFRGTYEVTTDGKSDTVRLTGGGSSTVLRRRTPRTR